MVWNAKTHMRIWIGLFFFFTLSVYPLRHAYPDQSAFYDERFLDEKFGGHIPGDITLYDERGASVNLKNQIDKPVILTLSYYRCSHFCPQMFLGLSEAIAKSTLVAGRDYRLITVSFDNMDTPGSARDLKANYIKAVNRTVPDDSWKFLTGDTDNIRKLADAVGIKYKKVMHGFIHPEILIFISPEGIITRYIHVSKFSYGVGYPVTFSPVDFNGAIADASKGIIGTEIRRTPLICFPHEPEQEEKFFHMLGVSGMATLILMFAFFIYLRAKAKKARPGANKD